MAFMLPKFIAIKTTSYPDRGHFYYNERQSSVNLGEGNVSSTLVKIEVERATSNTNYVHLRFSNSKRYWSLRANNNVIVAESNQPVEDTREPSCTLFQPIHAAGEAAGVFYLIHVPTGGRLLVDNTNWGVYVEVNAPDSYGHLAYVDLSTLGIVAFMLPKFIAIKTTSYPDRGHLYYNERQSSVNLGEENVSSTLVKIEVERATSNTNYVHLRFSNSNRYWSLRANSNVIVAESKQPVEDTTNPSCTLFQLVQAAGEVAGVFYLNHVPTGGRLLVDNKNWGVYVEVNAPDSYGLLTYVDWSTLGIVGFMLPKFIAIKTTSYPDRGHLYYNGRQSSVNLGEGNVFSTRVKIEVERATSNTNYVHLRFSNSNRYWSLRANSNVIVAESNQPVEDTREPSCTLFQPVQAAGEAAGVFYLKHVPTGGRLLVDNTNWGVYVEVNAPDSYGHLTYVDWSTLY
ncbi:uncharacterized protein LOC125203231 isoform X2 [Salvia hispanica]|uniref:uncharacterized protein LOC125203231 isoform X2 n=1 Tax=Salvia hispanica TaxID=49212 RepID=UPI00200998AA|nr:uncharacterized protein LOC125203231 isoform X2 [Salvia hispanica]